MKRFWSQVEIEPAPGGFGLSLDDRRISTPGRAPLLVPTRSLAQDIAHEWAAVEDRVDPSRMHFTRLANTALDRISPRRSEVAGEIASYGGTDLLCYRAPAPQGLVERQSEAWDPWIAWSRDTLAAPLVVTQGMTPAPQPPTSLARLNAIVECLDAFELAALYELVSLSGSLILGLAVMRGAVGVADAWAASRVDEDWQAEQWGVDSDAAAAVAAKRSDFERAAAFAALLA